MRKCSRLVSLKLVWLVRDGESKVTPELGFQPLAIYLPAHSSPVLCRSPWNRLQLHMRKKVSQRPGCLSSVPLMYAATWSASLAAPYFCISLLSVVVTEKGRDHNLSSKARPQTHRVHKQCLMQGGMLRPCREMKQQNPFCS